MAEKSGFFNGTEADPREYRAEEFAEYFNIFLSSGIAVENGKTGLQITAQTGMTVKEDIGNAIMLGYYYKNDAQLTFNIDAADTVLSRIDRIVLRLDLMSRKINTFVKKGTPSSSPVAPILQRDAIIHELSLAKINVPPGCTSITNSLIVDERMDTSVCGLITSPIVPPVQDMWNSFNSDLGEIQSAWDSWFQTRQNQIGAKLLVGNIEPTEIGSGDIWLKEL